MSSKKLVVSLALLLAGATTMAMAQNEGGDSGTVVRGKNAWMAIVTQPARPSPAPTTTPDSKPPGQVTIYGHLADAYPNGLYWCCGGYNVMGPNSGVGVQWMAAAFTPSANHTVTQIDVGAGFSQGTTNGIVLSLNLDNKGKPGKALKTWNISGLPRFGVCCGLTTGTASGIPITGGKQYWVVLKTNSSELDTVDGWNFDDTDQVNNATIASFTGTKWTVFQSTQGVAFAVRGSN